MEYNFEIIPNEQTPVIEQEVMSQKYIEKNRELFQAFLDFAESQTRAVGLAANQCSLNGERFMQRIFAMKNMKTHEWGLVIDPIILEFIGMKEEKLEGCLTWKGRNILAERFRAVKVGFYGLNGELYRSVIYGGFQGQIFQHEYNHIEGVPEEVVEAYYELPIPKKIPRNEKCPCGSGLKYKRCCFLYEN